MDERTLSSPPSLAELYAKALAGTVLPGGDELPAHVLVLEDVEVDRRRLTEYDRVCGFRLSDALPATYPHVLAFPLAMALMTERSFPFALLGLVHVENRIEQRRPLHADERLTLRVWCEALRDHPRGRQFDVVAEAHAGGELAWVDRSTYLRRGGGNGDGAGRSQNGRRRAEPPRGNGALVAVPGDVGRRYAAVSGDRNPIHLHDLAARLFGSPGAIAHGMWSKARCLAGLEGRLPGAFAVDVRFQAPLRIPARARLATRAGDGELRFALWSERSERPHLTGAVES